MLFFLPYRSFFRDFPEKTLKGGNVKRFTRFVAVAAFVVIAPITGFSQEDHANLMDVKTVSEQLFFSTVRIEAEKISDKGEPAIDVSTGFIVSYPLEGGKRADFLVASRHSVQNSFRGRFFFIRSRDGKPALGETYNILIEDFGKRWFFPNSPDVDIAVMPLAEIMRELSGRSWQVYYRGVSPEMSLGYVKEEDFDAIEEVILVGYPSGIFDVKNFIPVARRGITATPLSVDYAGKPQFLIDAAVFPGSSGSPVFLVNRGMYPDREGRIKIGNRVVFLGMVSALAMRKEVSHLEIEGVSELLPVLSTSQMMDIGVVYKAPAVFEIIRDILSRVSEKKGKQSSL